MMQGSEEEAVTVSKLQKALSDASRRNDYDMAIHELQQTKYLSSIPLDSILTPIDTTTTTTTCADENSTDLQSAEAEMMKKRINLNSMTFFHGTASSNNHTSSPFLTSLTDLCLTLCGDGDFDGGKKNQGGVDSRALYESIIKRISQKNTGADSYFKLNSIMGSAELMLMPMKSNDNARGGAAAAAAATYPIEIELFAEGGNIHANITSAECYGLFRKSDVKGFHPASPRAADNKPWVTIEARIRERVNFSNGRSVRSLMAKVVKD